MKRAVVLLSGGLDSATVLAIARESYEVTALSFRYGQRHAVELACAVNVAAALGAREHRVLDIDASALAGGSALTGGGDVPKDGSAGAAIPSTYVPARNTIFLAYALGVAEVNGARDLFIGANAVDYSGYPDCRPAFISAFQALANVATKAGVEGDLFTVHAPLISMSKAEIIKAGVSRGVDYALTWSCYDPQVRDGVALACGACDSCRIRARGFVDAGVPDPTPYIG
ncbi:MAG TPA: 7-cyano-7-deazaguanine synthase QueC [Myxococcota bacterium]